MIIILSKWSGTAVQSLVEKAHRKSEEIFRTTSQPNIILVDVCIKI